MNQIRLKYIASIEMGQSPPSSEYTTEDEGIPFLQGTAEFGEKYPSPIIYSLSPNKFSFKNDILFSVRAPVGEININNQKIGIGRGLCSIRAKNNNSQEFLWWALHAVRVQLKYLETGTTYSAVSTEDISNLVLPIHDLNIQNKIANYLDTEVAKIDALIDKKNQLIAILDEKKKAVINQAVTKGLDMNVCMKDSGVEWLGEIPKHWKVVKLKYLTNGLKYGANEAAEDDNHNDPRYIRITDIDENGDLKEETFRSIPLEVAEEYLLQDGDILLARSGATVGKSFLYKKEYGISAYAGYLIRIRCNAKISPKYMYYYTLSSSYWNQIYIDSIQATIQNFSGKKYANMIVVVPNYDEQEKIVDSLDSYFEKFNALKKKVLLSVDLLKEKRAAIISAAVNGELNANLS